MTPCLHRHGGAEGWSAREWRERRRRGDGDGGGGGGVSVVEEMRMASCLYRQDGADALGPGRGGGGGGGGCGGKGRCG